VVLIFEEASLAITTEMIKTLREATGAGVLDCKKALEAAAGDFDKATRALKAKGLVAAAKKESRQTNEGLVNVLVDEAGRVGAIVEVDCETDFVARTDDFKGFVEAMVKQVAHEAGVADVPALLARPFAGDKSITVGESLTQLIARLGENMKLGRFARMERTGPGLVEGYTHPGSRIGVIVHVSAGGEAVARSAAFRSLVHDLALQIAAAAPRYISVADIPPAGLEAERSKYQAQVADENKPDAIKERIISGKLDKWYEQICLLKQPFVKDDSLKVGDLMTQRSQELSTSLTIEQFIRYELGVSE
jgi:elongation factor Ts